MSKEETDLCHSIFPYGDVMYQNAFVCPLDTQIARCHCRIHVVRDYLCIQQQWILFWLHDTGESRRKGMRLMVSMVENKSGSVTSNCTAGIGPFILGCPSTLCWGIECWLFTMLVKSDQCNDFLPEGDIACGWWCQDEVVPMFVP
jgi:hypothetical protein